MVAESWDAFYHTDLQGLYGLLVAPALFLVYWLADTNRRGSAAPGDRFVRAYALVFCLGFAAWFGKREATLRGSMALALVLGLGQIAVGVANVLSGIPIELTGLHTALAGGLVLTLTHALYTAWSGGAPRAPTPPRG